MDDTEEYRFGPYRLIPRRHELFRDGMPVALNSRSVELLSALVEASGALVTKQALLSRVWPGQIHTEGSVWVAVSAVRKALGPGPDGEPYIVSMAARGYRFAALVTRIGPEIPAQAETAPGNLPLVIAPLIGRDAEIARCLALLEQSKLLTITGTGGVGKTRMALALGDAARGRYSDGVWFVELASLATPELVPETIAALLGLSVQGSRTAIQVVATYLRQKSLLLVLDNCEHVVTEAARVAEAILQNCPRVSILATSREPLRVGGEQSYPLPSLGLPDRVDGIAAAQALDHAAIRLFVARAGLTVEGFDLTDDLAPIVAAICRRLDGIPLALELAAPRLRVLTPRELLDRLDQRFGLLTEGSRTVLARHQTLRALIDWSWDHLSEAERVLLGRLAVFGGSFTIESVEAVAGTAPLAPARILDLVARLVDKSLVVALPAGIRARRYQLIETIRQYGAERLAESGDQATALRLARYLVTRFQKATEIWPTMADIEWLARYEPDLDNLRAALGWAFGPGGDTALGLQLVSYTSDFWTLLSLAPERRRWFETAAALLDSQTPPDVVGRIRAALADSNAFGQRRNVAPALEAAALFRTLGDPLWLGRALGLAGRSLMRPGEVAEAEPVLLEAEAVLRPLGPTKVLVSVLGSLGALRFFAGETPAARALTEEAGTIARRLGALRHFQIQTSNLAEHDLADGRIHDAIARGREVEASCRASGNLMVLSFCLRNLAGYLIRAGDLAAGVETAREALRLSQSLGDGLNVTMCLEHLALAAALAEDLVLAGHLIGYGDAFYGALGQARQHHEHEARQNVMGRLEAALDPAVRARLLAEGAAWSEDAVVAVALEE